MTPLVSRHLVAAAALATGVAAITAISADLSSWLDPWIQNLAAWVRGLEKSGIYFRLDEKSAAFVRQPWVLGSFFAAGAYLFLAWVAHSVIGFFGDLAAFFPLRDPEPTPE